MQAVKKLLFNFLLTVIILTGSSSFEYAQLAFPGKPVRITKSSAKIIPIINMPSFNVDSLVNSQFSGKQSQLKTDRFAKTFHVHLDYKIPDERYINEWRIPRLIGMARLLYRKYCNP